MTSDDTLDARLNPPDASGNCPICGGRTLFGIAKNLGYYRRCTRCGNIVNLKRRFLRLDRQSRQWR